MAKIMEADLREPSELEERLETLVQLRWRQGDRIAGSIPSRRQGVAILLEQKHITVGLFGLARGNGIYTELYSA